MPIGELEVEAPRPIPAMTEMSRRVWSPLQVGQATASAPAREVRASKRASQLWQRYSWIGITLIVATT